MQNEFEKQVRAKMDELRFAPTAPVWSKIEEQIRQKKDRRRMVLWLPLLLLLLAAGLVWINLDIKDRSDAASSTATRTSPASDPLGQKAKRLHEVTAVGGASYGEAVPELHDQPVQERETGPREASPASNRKPVSSVGRIRGGSVPGTVAQARNRGDVKKSELKASGEIESWKNDTTTSMQELTGPTQTGNEKNQSSPDSSKATEQPKQQLKKASRWQVAVTAQAGVSGITSGLGLANSLHEDLASDPMYLGSGSGSVPVTNGSVAISERQSSAAFALGLAMKKQIGKRVALSLGVRYNYYSTRTTVGRDSLNFVSGIRYYYGPNALASTDYSNSYHFVSIPVSVELQPLKRLPVNMHAGLSLSRLVASNALAYNARDMFYYKDNDAIRKTQVFAEMGLSYGFRVGSSSLQVGPQLQLGLNKLEKGNDNKHLYAFGLQAQYVF